MKTGKKLLILVLSMLMLLSVVPMTDIGLKADAVTHSGCFDGVTYGRSISNGQEYAVVAGLCNGDHDNDGYKEHPVASGKIIIRDTVLLEGSDALEVKEIIDYAFSANLGESESGLTDVVIEADLTKIGTEAFLRAPITSINIPGTVVSIGEKAFQGCTNLINVNIEGDSETLIDIGEAAFINCGIQYINLQRAKSIGANAFSYTSPQKIVLGSEIDTIGTAAFSNSTIGNFVLPEKTGTIGSGIFMVSTIDTVTVPEEFPEKISDWFIPTNKNYIKSFSVDENNPYYSSVNGVLFNKEISELIIYPSLKEDKEYEIPDTVKILKEMNFNQCANLEYVELPENLEYIEAQAFYGCPIKEISKIPNSVKKIDITAFFSHNLTDVYFDGTEEEWKSIEVVNTDYGIGAFYPTVTMHFNDETPEEPEHIHSFTSGVVLGATCEDDGIMSFLCKCGQNYTDIIPATGHKDTNGDYKCDNGCGYEYEKPSEPETPSDPSENCDCNCHKGGIVGFFFKIILFFQKLFKTNKVCDCGVSHY